MQKSQDSATPPVVSQGDTEKKVLQCLLRLGKPDSSANKQQIKCWLDNSIHAVQLRELTNEKLLAYVKKLSQADDASWNTWKTVSKKNNAKKSSDSGKGSGKSGKSGKQNTSGERCLWTDLKLRAGDLSLIHI